MHISEIFFKQKTLFWFTLLAIVVGGAYAYIRMGKLEDPEIVIKQAMIVTVYPGASAHEVELNVSAPLEQELRKQSDVSSITSESYPNYSKIMVEIAFSVPDREMEQRWDIMRRRVQSAAALLPQGAMQPMVFDDVGDVYGMFYAMTADGYSPEEMDRYARWVKQELLLVKGVRRVEVFGAMQPCVNVTLSSEKMARLGVLPAQILLTLEGQNKPVFAGVFEGKDARLRLTVSDKINELDDIRGLLIQSLSGEQIRLGDIAAVERSYAEPHHNLFWLNNRSALGISLSMEHGENIINVGERVEARLAELKRNIPVGFEFDKIFFQPERVSNAIKGFMGNLISSVLIVVLALMLTMGFRGGMIIGCGLLFTVLATLPVLYALDGTLQRISLGAFIVAMGMLVDNAIVVLDGILVDSRRRMPLRSALLSTAQKTAMPLLGATLIAVITFLPVFLTNDTAGIYARDLFLVLCISLLISWLLALVQVPMFASYFIKFKPNDDIDAKNEVPGEDVQRDDVHNHAAHRAVRRTLTFLLRHRAITIVASVVLLAAASLLFITMKNRFFPDFDYEQAYIEYTLPPSASPSRVIADLHSISDYLLATGKVSRVVASHGRTPSRYCLVRSVNQGSDSYGELIVDFHSYRELVKLKPKVEQELRERYPDAYIRMRQYNFTVKTSHSVEAQFSGPDPAVLKNLSLQAQDIMRANPIIDPATVCDNHEPPSLLLSAEYAQAAARRAGVSRSDLSNALLAATDGLPVGSFYEGETALPIYLRTRDAQGKRLTDINDVPVWTAAPNFAGVDISRSTIIGLATGGAEASSKLREQLISSTPLSSVTHGVKPTWETSMVYRHNGRRAVEVQCDPISGESAADARRAIRKQIESIPLPDGYAMQWKGEHELQHDALENMLGFIPISAVLIILILLLLFGDVRKMAIVIFCLPFAAIGIAPAMVLTGQPFTFMAIIGVMGLAGMLIKNSIVLLDETTRLIREENYTPYHAVIQASVARTRPVMMASLTTVLGMAPLVLDPMYCSLAVAVMSGLVVGTVVTLLLVPVFYGVFFGVKKTSAPVLLAVLLAVGLLAHPHSATAQDTLSLADCRQLALQNSEDMKIAEKQQQRAAAEKQAAFTHYLPRISASASLAYLFNDIDMSTYLPTYVPDPASGKLVPNTMKNPLIGGDLIDPATGYPIFNMYAYYPLDISIKGAYLAGIKLEQPIFAGGKIVAGNRMANIGVAMAEENARMQQASTLAEVDKAYWIYVSVHEKLKILDRYDALLGRLDSSMQAGVSVAMMSEKDLLKVQSKRSSLAYDRQRAQHGLELSRMALCRLVGKDFDATITPADTSIFADDNTTASPANTTLSADISSRPEYRLMQQQVDFNAQQVWMTRADFLPTIGLGAGYNHLGGMKFAGMGKSFNMPFAMLTASIPLFHFGEGARKIKVARLQQDISTIELEKNAKLLSLQAQQAAHEWLDAQAQITTANDALRLANEDLRVSRAAYENSMGTFIDYLDAQVQWQQAYSNLIEARATCKIRETDYLKAVGKL